MNYFSSLHHHIITSTNHHITTSPHHHITTSPHHHIITSPHHHITTSSHHHIISSPHHHIITSPNHQITTSSHHHFPLIIRLISLSLLSASTGVRLLISRFFISSRICSSTGSSSWKKLSCRPSRCSAISPMGFDTPF